MHVDDSNTAIISVAELNRRAREFIEAGFPLLWVAGEISNFTRAASGHCYFSLKDATAQVRCVYFRHKAALIDWKPENGMQVEVRAVPTLYEARGDFQLTVEGMRRSGLGALFEAFERLKRKLELEGLFDASRRKPIPEFPRSVGVVTSPKAAALRDVLTTLARRMPGIRVVLYPAPVQGEGAGEKIAQAVRTASARMEVDVLIVCRGGGSMEDLWAFNEEIVARAIVDCAVPVVSGIGHETDFTIADFVADARAPTPTAAAELVSPNRTELLVRLKVLGVRLARDIDRALNTRMQLLDYLGKRLVDPGERIGVEFRQLGQLALRLRSAATHALDAASWSLSGFIQRLRTALPDVDAHLARQQELRLRLQHGGARMLEQHDARLVKVTAGLAHLNPQAVLERGYSIVERRDGQIVRSAEQVTEAERVRLIFARGAAQARVERIETPDE
ncbi:MAG TPA: exodeoxyribonuclease VII large subunit [Burkholderiales bacterium]|nr:exodeoxyribonuclease VII large subunit [Burkholderiales bacterium]